MAGLPVAALAELRFDESAARAEAIDELGTWLANEGAALSEDLFTVIGRLDDTPVRPALVGLRRALFQVRKPGAREWNSEVAALLPTPVVDRIRAWNARLATLGDERGGLPAALAGERDRAASALRKAASAPEFRRALSQASPSLSGELDKWLADERRTPRPQILIRLAKYLARASAKTSPYSTFMVGGFGAWTEGGRPVRLAERQEPCGVVELGGMYIQSVRNALAHRPELADDALVRVNPSLTIHGEAVMFIGRPPAESIVTMPLSPGLRECLRLADDRRDERTGELTDELTVAGLRDRLGTAVGAAPADAERYVARLLGAGLLEAHLPVPDHAEDPMGDLATWLAGHGDAGFHRLVAGVQAELARDVPVADVDGHRRRQHALHQAMKDLAGRLGLPESVVADTAKGAFHETAVARGPMVACSLPYWRPALNDLDVIRRWATIFDPDLPARLALGAYAGERFGVGARVPFLTLHRAVQEELAGDGTTPAAADLRALLKPASFPESLSLEKRRLERIRLLDGLRATARRSAMGRPGADGVIRVDPEDLAAQVRAWPEWVGPASSVACYVQALPEDPRFVLNTLHGGHGRGLARLEYLIGRAGGKRTGRPPTPTGLAELGGLLGSTLNLRVPSAPHELDYPFTVSGRPDAQRIALRDLVAVHDPATDLVNLVSAESGSPIVPVHLGLLMNLLLPPAARFLVQAFGPPYPVHPAAPPLNAMERFEPTDEIVRHPRVDVGHVVLRRARWLMPTARVPARLPGETDAGYLVRLTAWRRSEGIPERCFVRAWQRDVRFLSTDARKPVYVDFASWFLVLGFERQLRGTERVLIEEALPDPDDASGLEAADARVTEFLIEMSDHED